MGGVLEFAELTGLWLGDGDQYPLSVWESFDVCHASACSSLKRQSI